MNSCVSCLTWCIAIPVLSIAGFVLGPWLIVLAAVVVLIAVAMTLGSGSQSRGIDRCPTCGRPYGPMCGTCQGCGPARRGHW